MDIDHPQASAPFLDKAQRLHALTASLAGGLAQPTSAARATARVAYGRVSSIFALGAAMQAGEEINLNTLS